MNAAFKETERFFYFDAEVSNENTDLQGQIVLQSTLLNAKKYFLENGVISVDHKHRKRILNWIKTDGRYVVGKPVAVYCKGKSTWIRGKLFKDNALARVVIELLRRESNKVKASIGGLSPTCVRVFYVGEHYPPCGYYEEINERVKKDEELKKLKEIFEPVPRPEGAPLDCLHCRMLKEQLGIVCRDGPWQGKERICDNYYEIAVRPEGKSPHCLYCLNNYNCTRDRVLRVGQPCGQYNEYKAGITEKTAC